MSVIEHDFGRSRREATKMLMRLFKCVAAHEQRLLNDPVELFNMAAKEIVSLRKVINDALYADRTILQWAHDDSGVPTALKTIVVPLDEYERLLGMRKVLMAACRD